MNEKICGKIEKLQKIIVDIEKNENDLSKELGIEDHVENFLRILEVLHLRVKIMDSAIASLEKVTGLQERVDNLNNRLEALSNAELETKRTTLSDIFDYEKNIDYFSDILPFLYTPLSPIELVLGDEVLQSFHKRIAEDTNDLNARNLEVEKNLKILEEEIKEKSLSINNFSEEIQELYKKQEKEWGSMLSLENPASGIWGEQFTTFLEELRVTNEKNQEKNQLRIESSLQQVVNLQEKIAKESAEVLSKLNEDKIEANNLVGIIANTAMSGVYQKHANQAFVGRVIFQVVTVLALAGFVGVVVYMFFHGSAEISYMHLIQRMFVGASFLGIAYYCGKQAINYQAEERVYRSLHMELATLSAYLKELDIEIAKKIKEDFVKQYFKGWREFCGDNNVGVPNLIEQLGTKFFGKGPE